MHLQKNLKGILINYIDILKNQKVWVSFIYQVAIIYKFVINKNKNVINLLKNLNYYNQRNLLNTRFMNQILWLIIQKPY